GRSDPGVPRDPGPGAPQAQPDVPGRARLRRSGVWHTPVHVQPLLALLATRAGPALLRTGPQAQARRRLTPRLRPLPAAVDTERLPDPNHLAHRIVVPTPYRVGPANVYAFDAGPVTLFDCGPNTPAAENALRLGLAEHGLAFEQVARVVISHGHPDHYGLAPTIQRASGATVYVGEHDLPKINERASRFATGALLMEAGVPVDLLVEMDQERKRTRKLHPKVEDAVPLAGKERFAFDRFTLEVLHLPGHTSGHV